MFDTILESTDIEEPEQNPVNNIEHQSHPDDNNLNKTPDQESIMDFQPDLSISSHPENQEDTQNQVKNHLENMEDTQNIIELEVVSVEQISEKVLPTEDGILAPDIRRRKPCFGWIGDGEDNELVILERSN